MYDLENLFGEEDDVGSNVGTKGSRHATAPNQKRAELGFVGLVNQGATCYLNSMLQMLYMTPELREGIYNLPPDTLDIPQKDVVVNVKAGETEDTDFSDLPALIDPAPSPRPEKAEEEPVIDAGLMEDYLAMGFAEDQVKRALVKFRGRDQSVIIDWLLSGEGESSAESGDVEMGSLFSPIDESTSQVDPSVLTQRIMDINNSPESRRTCNSPTAADWWKTQLGGTSPTNEPEAVELKEMGSSVKLAEETTAEGPKQEKKPEEKKRDGKKRFLYSLQSLFAHMQQSDQLALATDQITNSFGWTGSETLQQHDVHELFRLFFDAIERSLLAVKSTNLINDLYRGEFVNQVKCMKCGYTSTRPEDFHDVSVVVKGFDSLNDSLASYVTEESLTGDNRYFCEKCAAKVDAKRGQKFHSLPPFLMFALQRFEYDWQHDKRIKITSNYSFPLVLDMAPYLDSAKEESEGKGKQPKGAILLEDGIVQPAFDPSSPHLYELFAVIIHQGGAYGGHYHAYVRNVMIPTPVPNGHTHETTSTEQNTTHTTQLPPTSEPTQTPQSTNSTQSTNPTQSTSTNFTESTQSTQTAHSSHPTQPEPTTELINSILSTMSLIDPTKLTQENPSTTQPVNSTSPDFVNNVQSPSASSPSPSSSSSTSSSSSSTTPPSSSTTPYSLEKLLQEPWFDFDDTRVSRLHAGCIASQYGGKTECAYMLVYRKVTLASKTYLTPPVPEHLFHEIEKNNITLNEERVTYDQALYKLTLGVRLLRHYDQKEGGMIEKPVVPELEVSEDKPSIEADLRDTVEDFKKRLANAFPNDVPTWDKLVLQEVTSRTGWLKLGQPLRDNTTLKQAGLRDGATIIAWVGQEALGVNVEGPPITLEVFYYYGTQDPIEFQVTIAEQATLKKLKEAISLKSEIPVDHMSLCRVGPHKVEPLHELDDTTPLSLAHISDKSTITVESLPEGTSSFAIEHLSKLLEVFILDETTGTRSASPISLRIEKEASVVELKQKALVALKSEVPHDKCRLRRTQSLGVAGNIIGNEKNAISAVGIQAGQLLILELGEVANQDFLTIRFTVDLGDYARTHKINVPKRTTVADCKMKMLQSLDSTVPPQNSRLRKTDVFSEASSDIITDETRTLEENGVHNEDLLVLEIGKSAVKSSISLHAQLYLPPVFVSKPTPIAPTPEIPSMRPPGLADELANGLASALTNSPHVHAPLSHSSSSLSDSADSLMLTNLIPANLLPSSLVLPGPATPTTPPSDPLLTPVTLPSTSFTPTTTTESHSASASASSASASASTSASESASTSASESASTLDPSITTPTPAPDSATPTAVPASIQSENSETERGETPEIAAFSPALWAQHSIAKKRGNSTIRLGDVEVDFAKTTVGELKKKLHAMDILSAMPSYEHLRIWFREKLLTKNSEILKKYHITYDATIVVQTLNAPDPEESTLLYLHRIDPTKPNAPVTPPIEIFVPLLQSIPMLRDYVSRALDIPVEYIAMAKYAMANKVPTWKMLLLEDTTENVELPPVLGPHSLEFRRGRNTRKRANSKHVMVKDGDIIGVIDTRASPDSLEYFKKFPPISSTSHARHHSYTVSSSPPSSRRSTTKTRAPEAVLKINLDWE